MKPVTFIHISDTHIGPTADYARHGFQSEPGPERLLRALEELHAALLPAPASPPARPVTL